MATRGACINVVKQKPVLVTPASPTPNHSLYLSNLDNHPANAFTYSAMDMFRANPRMKERNVVELLEQALKAVLVPYYPLAGRLKTTSGGKLEVDCNAAGAVFVRAYADATLDDYQSLQRPALSWNQLCQEPDESAGYDFTKPPLVVQMTELRCGSLITVVSVSHCVCDCQGTSQFIRAWAEMARGVETLSVTPVWERELLKPRSPLQVRFLHTEVPKRGGDEQVGMAASNEDLSVVVVNFESSPALTLKKLVHAESGIECTAFEAVAAHLWRAWTRVLGFPLSQKVSLCVLADMRSRLNPPLPKGFYGNCAAMPCAVTTAEELLKNPLSDAVKLVQKAKAQVTTEEYFRSLVDCIEEERPTVAKKTSALYIMKTWQGMLGLPSDFGWGKSEFHRSLKEVPGHLDSCVLSSPRGADTLTVVFSNIPNSAVENLKASLHV